MASSTDGGLGRSRCRPSSSSASSSRRRRLASFLLVVLRLRRCWRPPSWKLAHQTPPRQEDPDDLPHGLGLVAADSQSHRVQSPSLKTLVDQPIAEDPQVLADPPAAAPEQPPRRPVVDGRLGHLEEPGGLVDRQHRRVWPGPMRVGEGRGDLGLGQFQVAVLAPHVVLIAPGAGGARRVASRPTGPSGWPPPRSARDPIRRLMENRTIFRERRAAGVGGRSRRGGRPADGTGPAVGLHAVRASIPLPAEPRPGRVGGL